RFLTSRRRRWIAFGDTGVALRRQVYLLLHIVKVRDASREWFELELSLVAKTRLERRRGCEALLSTALICEFWVRTRVNDEANACDSGLLRKTERSFLARVNSKQWTEAWQQLLELMASFQA
ncbi:hypothetical protein MLD52_22750, partial [Puniceicoccaceae bacterium K14]|nr:hypothetical protein [Puniceicoccaceae bacterium K14]